MTNARHRQEEAEIMAFMEEMERELTAPSRIHPFRPGGFHSPIDPNVYSPFDPTDLAQVYRRPPGRETKIHHIERLAKRRRDARPPDEPERRRSPGPR